MAAGEISEKLGRELYERIEHLERFCDERALKGKQDGAGLDVEWASASVMAFDLRSHLLHHLNQNAEGDDE